MESISFYCNLPGYEYDRSTSLERVRSIAQHAERYGFEGVLLHFNHHMPDPFLAAIYVIQHTRKLKPIVAVQPYYHSPLSAAKMIQSIAFLYGRGVMLNVIAGAAKNELEQVGDSLDHDERYGRLAEYMAALKKLLGAGEERITFEGNYYRFRSVDFQPGLAQAFIPQMFVAGSSDACVETAAQYADTFITHPGPVKQFERQFGGILRNHRIRKGIKLGVIAREHANAAWEAARERYPMTVLGKLSAGMKQRSESAWLRHMAYTGACSEQHDNVYWMGGFTSGKANHPILVGNYQDIAEYLDQYVKCGVSECIVGGLESESDFAHMREVRSRLGKLLEP